MTLKVQTKQFAKRKAGDFMLTNINMENKTALAHFNEGKTAKLLIDMFVPYLQKFNKVDKLYVRIN